MSVRDAISHAIYGDPAAMKDSLSSTLDAKVADALELKRISVASEYFNMPEEEYEEYEEAEVDEGAVRDAAKAVGSSAADAARTATHKIRLGRTREKYHSKRAKSSGEEGDDAQAEKHAKKASSIRSLRWKAAKSSKESPTVRQDARRSATPSTRESYDGETLEARDPRTPYDPNEGRGKYFAGSRKTKKEIEIKIEKEKGTRKKGRDPRGLTFTGQEK
jgi:hypothetical protein